MQPGKQEGLCPHAAETCQCAGVISCRPSGAAVLVIGSASRPVPNLAVAMQKRCVRIATSQYTALSHSAQSPQLLVNSNVEMRAVRMRLFFTHCVILYLTNRVGVAGVQSFRAHSQPATPATSRERHSKIWLRQEKWRR